MARTHYIGRLSCCPYNHLPLVERNDDVLEWNKINQWLSSSVYSISALLSALLCCLQCLQSHLINPEHQSFPVVCTSLSFTQYLFLAWHSELFLVRFFQEVPVKHSQRGVLQLPLLIVCSAESRSSASGFQIKCKRWIIRSDDKLDICDKSLLRNTEVTAEQMVKRAQNITTIKISRWWHVI